MIWGKIFNPISYDLQVSDMGHQHILMYVLNVLVCPFYHIQARLEDMLTLFHQEAFYDY